MRAPTSKWRILRLGFAMAAVAVCLQAGPTRTGAAFAVSDSLYLAHHPRLLFRSVDLPALRFKVTDGGYDADAFDFVRDLAENFYPLQTTTQLLGDYYALNTIPNLGVAGWLASPVNDAALDIGRDLTVYIADNYDVNNDEAGSGLRLRALVLGYDMFFSNAPESLRAVVRDEIAGYMTYMTTRFAYELFEYRPYLANHSAMFAGPLGMAAICLDGETDPQLVSDALDKADGVIDSLITYQFDAGGAYKEGSLYGAWVLRQLIPYFHARKRFDRYDYAARPEIRNVERWLPYEIMPEGEGKTNNLGDSPYHTRPLAWHTTYCNWAQFEWGSGLAAWLWEHTAGPFGTDMGIDADKASTVLWNLGLAPVEPGASLPPARLWRDRGLYYYRSGWPSGMSSDDVVFSFFSGKFHGGHWQEDINQFTLYAYGGKYAIDHGAGNVSRNSEAHNMVFVDGAGQHNAGNSIGTDGRIASALLSDFADYLLGDATAAYTTHSEFNEQGWPFPGSDWSWGIKGENPVDHALRTIVAVHEAGTPPYFIVLDDIDKDGTPHDYEWRFHTLDVNAVDLSANPIAIDAGTSSMDLHVLHPDFTSVAVSSEAFDNGTLEPNSTLIKLAYNTTNPRFATLLLPTKPALPSPVVSCETHPWGFAATLAWPGGAGDVIIGNHSGGVVTWGADSVETDAALAVMRYGGGAPPRYLVVDGTTLAYDGVLYARFNDGPASCVIDGSVLRLSRGDADFEVLDTGINAVEADGLPVVFIPGDGYVYASTVVGVEDPVPPPRSFDVTTYPNPFNPTVTIVIELPGARHVTAEVFDALGRRVRSIADRPAADPTLVLSWDGTNHRGFPVPSGVYFLRVVAGDLVRTSKLVVTR